MVTTIDLKCTWAVNVFGGPGCSSGQFQGKMEMAGEDIRGEPGEGKGYPIAAADDLFLLGETATDTDKRQLPIDI